MPAEQFANLAETTLSAAYTAGQGFIQVTSVSGFPALPTFRVRLGNTGKTIFRVDWVYGTRFYGVAEENDANGNSGDAVTIVISKVLLERFLQSPNAGGYADQIWSPTGPAGANGFGPLWRLGGLPDLTTWTQTNWGTSSFKQYGRDGTSFGMIAELLSQSGASTNTRILRTTMPARPFTLTVGYAPHFNVCTGVGGNLYGLTIGPYESGTGKFIQLGAYNFNLASGTVPCSIAYQLFTSATAGSTLYFNHTGGTNFPQRVSGNLLPPLGVFFLRYSDDGTNTILEYSWDKMSWILLGRQARTTGFTSAPDQIHISMFAQGLGTSPSTQGYLFFYEVAQPGVMVPGTGRLSVAGQAATRTP
jgi:hypothetical protein